MQGQSEKAETYLHSWTKAENGAMLETYFSLAKLIDWWDKEGSSQNPQMHSRIANYLEKHPQLRQPLKDEEEIQKHSGFFPLIFSALLPAAAPRESRLFALIPGSFTPVFWSEAIVPLLEAMQGENAVCSLDQEQVYRRAVYMTILRLYYGIEISFHIPMTITIPLENGLRETYRMDVDKSFIDIHPKAALPELTEEDKKFIVRHIARIDLIAEKLPLSDFVLEGFLVMRAVDVTQEEAVSEVQKLLIGSDGFDSHEKFDAILSYLRDYFRKTNIHFDIAAMRGNEVLLINNTLPEEVECIYADTSHVPQSYFAGSVYERAVLSKEPVLEPELEAVVNKSSMEEKLIREGVRSVIVYPLLDGEEVIGVATLYSNESGSFHSGDLVAFNQIVPLFTAAVRQGLDNFENRLQALIQKEFTSIHSSIAWRFQEAALRYFDATLRGKEPVMEELVFSNVYPLYAASDIRGSSSFRNDAIRADVMRQVSLLEEILLSARAVQELPVFDELLYRLSSYTSRLQDELATGDELEITSFLKREIESYLDTFAGFSEEAAEKVTEYKKVSGSHGLYEKREAFDKSVSEVNRTISAFLDAHQEEAQKMFPHYFEKSATDGIEFSMYIGNSITAAKEFETIYLKNLRLWQFIALCRIAHLSEELAPSLPVTLHTTHLIVVQDHAIDVRFDRDENDLHVEGAYNIRYEIMKKRIDKARIKETGERLTQPGKIAIVYSQQNEGREYREYAEYLKARGCLQGEFEDLLLEDLQGIHGLRALRVSVDLDSQAERKSVVDEMKKILQGEWQS